MGANLKLLRVRRILRLGFRAAVTDRECLEVVLPSGSTPAVPAVRALSRSCNRSLICTAPVVSPAVWHVTAELRVAVLQQLLRSAQAMHGMSIIISDLYILQVLTDWHNISADWRTEPRDELPACNTQPGQALFRREPEGLAHHLFLVGVILGLHM